MGGLLHDVGKIVYRAGLDAGNHSESGPGGLKILSPSALSSARSLSVRAIITQDI